MKKKLIAMLLLIGAVLPAAAQQIAVVNGSTLRTCTTLTQALNNATDGSVIYLPAGAFQISDVRVTHRVSIIGRNHKPKSLNADGTTTISGTLHFDAGSDGSVVMGCYVSGNVNIGYDSEHTPVHNIFVRYCNLNAVNVYGPGCTGTTVNQCYIRSSSGFNGAPAILTNNVMNGTNSLNGGIVSNNIVVAGSIGASNTTIINNVFMADPPSASNCPTRNNMSKGYSWGDDGISISDDWNAVFVKPDFGISSNSNFHFTTNYAKYESSIGIYGGKNGIINFHEDALPPVPYVRMKTVPETTNFNGMLDVNLTVMDGSK